MHLIFYLTRRVYSVNRIEIKFRLRSNARVNKKTCVRYFRKSKCQKTRVEFTRCELRRCRCQATIVFVTPFRFRLTRFRHNEQRMNRRILQDGCPCLVGTIKKIYTRQKDGKTSAKYGGTVRRESSPFEAARSAAPEGTSRSFPLRFFHVWNCCNLGHCNIFLSPRLFVSLTEQSIETSVEDRR